MKSENIVRNVCSFLRCLIFCSTFILSVNLINKRRLFQVAEGEMVENKLVIPDEMMQYLNQSILGTDTVTPAKTDSTPPEPKKAGDNDTKDNENTNSSDKISDIATSDDSLLKNLGAIGSDLNISDIPVDLRSLDVSMSGNSGSLLGTKSLDDNKNTPLQEQVIPEAANEKEKDSTKPATSVPTSIPNPLQSLQTMAANQTEQSNRLRANQMSQKQNPSSKTVVMSQNVMSPQSIALTMLSPQSLPHSAMSPQSVMSPHNILQNVMSPPSVYNVMSPQSVMSVMSPQHNVMSPQSMQSLMSPQIPNQMMSPRHNNMGSPMSQNMASPMMNMASPMAQNMSSPMAQNIASPMSHGMPSPMHPGLQSPMAQGMTSPMIQNMNNMSMNSPQVNHNQMINMNQNQMMNAPQMPAPPNYMNRQNCNQKIPNRNMPNQYQNQNFNQAPPYPVQNQQIVMRPNIQHQYTMIQQYNQSQMAMHPMNNQQTIVYNNQMMYPQPGNYQNNQMQQMQMSRSSVMSVDNSGNMSRGAIANYCEQQAQQCPQMPPPQYSQNMHYPQPPPYNSVVNAANVMGPPPPKNNHQYNQGMMNNNQYYNHQRPYNQWDYPGNQFNKHNMQKSVQNSVNMSTGSQKPNGMRNSVNCQMKDQTDCSMNSLRSQNNQANQADVQVWDISQSQIEASNGRKKNQNNNNSANNTNTMRQDTYQRTLEYVENCENWKSSEMVSSSTHPLQGGDNMVVNDLQTSLSSFYEENQYLQMIQ